MRRILDLKTAKVAVELTNRCNLRCSMCPMNKLGRPDADMEWWLVEKVAADFKANGLTVSWLHEMGDPLLYPRLPEAIDLFPNCSVSTNAMLLDERMGKELLATSLRRIRLCLDTINPRVYPFIRRGGRFEEVVANIRSFLELSKGSAMTVEIQRLITLETAQESVRAFEEFFHLDRYPQAKVIEKTCEPLDTSDETPMHQSFYGCFQGYPFRWFIVLADGRVTHCCYDAHGQQPIGDMKTQTVQEIVDSVRLVDAMAAFKAKDWQTLPRCGVCYQNAEGKPPFYDRLLALGHQIDRVIPLKPLARRLINR
ncbi:MAG: radical SAM protein [Thermoanaerobaculaceae bacterium]|nr:radical SAM protein [Thermoanaerobaculaceae bacterium]